MSARTYARWTWALLAFLLAVVVWGAFVRATGSGAGCGAHWPACNGELVPRAPALETVIEFTHRVSSGAVTAAVVLWAVLAFAVFPPGHRVRRRAPPGGPAGPPQGRRRAAPGPFPPLGPAATPRPG